MRCGRYLATDWGAFSVASNQPTFANFNDSAMMVKAEMGVAPTFVPVYGYGMRTINWKDQNNNAVTDIGVPQRPPSPARRRRRRVRPASGTTRLPSPRSPRSPHRRRGRAGSPGRGRSRSPQRTTATAELVSAQGTKLLRKLARLLRQRAVTLGQVFSASGHARG